MLWKKIRQIIHVVLTNYWPVFLLFITVLILFFTNVKPGTWLIGWDSYTPNLNFPVNFERNIFGVWQEYRGVGLLDGLSHVANLFHTITIFILSLLFPGFLLRYIFQFLCLFLGGIGIYFLSHSLLSKKIPSFLTALFYILNIGTIQMFYLPLEVFSVHFAALPWLTLFLLNYLQEPSIKKLSLFFLFSLIFTPQSYVPTVFIVYFFSVIAILFFHIKQKNFIKKVFLIGLMMFMANAFWAMPFAYSMVKNINVISNAKINLMSNEVIRLNNKEFGDFTSTALIHGLYLSFINQDNPSQINLVMQTWVNHIQSPYVETISWFFFLLAITGIFVVFLRKKYRFYPFILLFIFSFLMLGNDIPILSFFFESINKYVPVFGSAYRFVFTKFSILYVFCYSLLLGVGIDFLLQKIKNRFVPAVFLFFFCILISFYSWPAVNGHFFFDGLRVKIPDSYFELIDFFNHQDRNNRISILPQPDFWGWTYNSWGFGGSGFIWQGLPQSTMDGAFLPWSSENESYYLESSTAINSKDIHQLENVLEKYQINWIVVDHTIKQNGESADQQNTRINDLKALINSSKKIRFIKSIGDIDIYSSSLYTPSSLFITNPLSISRASSNSEYSRRDDVFNDLNNYISPKTSTSFTIQAEYPFQNFNRERALTNIQISDKEDRITIKEKTTENLQESELTLPNLEDSKNYLFPIKIAQTPEKIVISLFYPFSIQNGNNEEIFPSLLSNLEFPKGKLDRKLLIEINDKKIFIDNKSQGESMDQINLQKNENIKVDLLNLTPDSKTATQSAFFAKDIQSVDITQDFWKKMDDLIQKKYNINSDNSSLFAHFIAFPVSPELTHSVVTYNCDTFKRGTFQKEVETDGVLYIAHDQASLCDNFGFGDISHNIPYLLQIKGKNIETHGMNVYLYNWVTNKNDLETILPNTSFDQFFSLLPQPFIIGSGESVNLETRSFLRSTSINKLEKMSFYPVSLDLLARLRIEPNNENTTFDNKIQINDIQKIQSFYYRVKVVNNSDQGFLTLSQGFDNGWIAFSSKDIFHPFQHVKYNGWANAWLLPSGEYNVVILYWPQLLSFAGYGLLGATFAGFGVAWMKSGKRRPSQKVSDVTKKKFEFPKDRLKIK